MLKAKPLSTDIKQERERESSSSYIGKSKKSIISLSVESYDSRIMWFDLSEDSGESRIES